MAGHREDFYIRLRARIVAWLKARRGRTERWGNYLLVGPDLLHLLCGLVGDPQVAFGDKLRLGGVIIYFFSPVDLLPEILLGPLGYLDDIALAAYVLNGLLNRTPVAVLRRHWAGEDDVLQVLRRTLAAVDKAIGSGLWRRIRKGLG